MVDIDIEKMMIDAILPHVARHERKVNGYPEGNLKCEGCGSMTASRNRQRTAYVDSDNMATLCPECQREADQYWDDMWSNAPGHGG
jgi:hypothetical protein